jgi:hypothetical protein
MQSDFCSRGHAIKLLLKRPCSQTSVQEASQTSVQEALIRAQKNPCFTRIQNLCSAKQKVSQTCSHCSGGQTKPSSGNQPVFVLKTSNKLVQEASQTSAQEAIDRNLCSGGQQKLCSRAQQNHSLASRQNNC